MAVAEQVGGLPSVAAIMVIIAGLFGAVLGYPLFRLIGVKAPIAKGLTMGTVSHALGTAKAAEENYQEGAFSSLGFGDLRCDHVNFGSFIVSTHHRYV